MTTEPPKLQPHPAYFAVGPKPHEITCPYCKSNTKTVIVRSLRHCFSRRQYCPDCGEYLGTFRRPQL